MSPIEFIFRLEDGTILYRLAIHPNSGASVDYSPGRIIDVGLPCAGQWEIIESIWTPTQRVCIVRPLTPF